MPSGRVQRRDGDRKSPERHTWDPLVIRNSRSNSVACARIDWVPAPLAVRWVACMAGSPDRRVQAVATMAFIEFLQRLTVRSWVGPVRRTGGSGIAGQRYGCKVKNVRASERFRSRMYGGGRRRSGSSVPADPPAGSSDNPMSRRRWPQRRSGVPAPPESSQRLRSAVHKVGMVGFLPPSVGPGWSGPLVRK